MFLPPRSPDEDWLGVVIAIPEPWVSALSQARVALGDPMGAAVPAHITLVPPIAVPTAARTDVIRHLRSIAQKHRPFRVKVAGAGTFAPTSPVAFVNVVEGSSECSMLAEDLRSGPLDYPLRFPYHPHVTLAAGVDQDVLDRAMQIADTVDATWTVPGFRLDRVDPNGMYHSQALFDLEAN